MQGRLRPCRPLTRLVQLALPALAGREAARHPDPGLQAIRRRAGWELSSSFHTVLACAVSPARASVRPRTRPAPLSRPALGALCQVCQPGKDGTAGTTRPIATQPRCVGISCCPPVCIGSIACPPTPLKGCVSGQSSRITQAHQLVGAVLTYAQRTGKIAKNVAREIKRDEDLPQPSERERRYLTHAELLRLAKATDRFETLTLVLGYCGLRFGEAAALRRRHAGTRS